MIPKHSSIAQTPVAAPAPPPTAAGHDGNSHVHHHNHDHSHDHTHIKYHNHKNNHNRHQSGSHAHSHTESHSDPNSHSHSQTQSQIQIQSQSQQVVVSELQLTHIPGINSNNHPLRKKDPIRFEMDLVNCNKAVYSLLTTLTSFYPKHIKIAGPYFNPPTVVWTTRGCVRNDIEELLEFEEDHHSCHRIIISRFPGMKLLCMKHEMANRLNFMKKLFPTHYDFYPPTWNLNVSLATLETAFEKADKKAYIVKTGNGAQGSGIRIVHTMREALNAMKYFTRNNNNPRQSLGVPIILQEYCDNPLLTSDGYKFDFRIYVVLQSLEPLNFYVCRDGLARICTEKYQSVTNTNANQQYMHFTNYSINKNNQSSAIRISYFGVCFVCFFLFYFGVFLLFVISKQERRPNHRRNFKRNPNTMANTTSHNTTSMSNSSSASSITSDHHGSNHQHQHEQYKRFHKDGGMQDSEVNEFIQIKQTIDSVLEDIMSRFPDFNPYKFWDQIDNIVIKTLITFTMHLKSTYKKNFPLNNNKPSNQRIINQTFLNNTNTLHHQNHTVNTSNNNNNNKNNNSKNSNSNSKTSNLNTKDKLSHNGYNVHSGHRDNSYCFHVIGFDILLDENLKPWLIEVNDSPSLAVSSQIDFDIKSSVVESILQILGILPVPVPVDTANHDAVNKRKDKNNYKNNKLSTTAVQSILICYFCLFGFNFVTHPRYFICDSENKKNRLM